MQVFGQHDEGTLNQMKACVDADNGAIGVLCADGHKGYSQPVGGVVAYRDKISISGVGFDISCGNLACKTNLKYQEIKPDIKNIMDEVVNSISFGVGRINAIEVDHDLFDFSIWKHPLVRPLKAKAKAQLGTVGAGNHYIDIFADEEDVVWVGVHFGSRGLGHGIATAFLKAAGGKDGMDVPPTLVKWGTALADDYFAAMELGGAYAYAGREWVTDFVVKNILQAEAVDSVHNNHNFAWMEYHNGETLCVVRKGATPAFPGQRGFVGGSMGDDAVIIEGVDSELSRKSLYSTVHGAGRIMSRTQAKGKYKFDPATHEIRTVQEPAVKREEWLKWIKDKNVCLRGGDLDESPQAYRRLNEVLAEHAGTIKILHVLRPVGVAMAHSGVADPYKD